MIFLFNHQTPGAPPVIVALFFMTTPIPINIDFMTAIPNACEGLSRPFIIAALNAAMAIQGLPQLEEDTPASYTTLVDMVKQQVEDTNMYEPETRSVWIDPKGVYKVDLTDFLL
jgi:hypothetical protein